MGSDKPRVNSVEDRKKNELICKNPVSSGKRWTPSVCYRHNDDRHRKVSDVLRKISDVFR